ncbi:hypothetical protein F7P83_11095 [Brevibacterium luteolum]|nr:hypothetical protein [Brevibacterium luteolum]
MRRPRWLNTLILAAAAFVIVRIVFHFFDAPWDVLISVGLAVGVLVTDSLWTRCRHRRNASSDSAEPSAFTDQRQ